MKKDLLTITSVALSTAALTVLTFWSSPIEAGSETQTQAPKVAQPKLVANGIEFSLVPVEGKTYKADDQPAFVLTAQNTAAQPATANVRLVMDAMSVASAMSRVAPTPSMIWHQDSTIALKPNEKKTISFATQTKLPASRLVRVSMQKIDANTPPIQPVPNQTLVQAFVPVPGAQSQIVALSFSTLASAPQPMLAHAK